MAQEEELPPLKEEPKKSRKIPETIMGGHGPFVSRLRKMRGRLQVFSPFKYVKIHIDKLQILDVEYDKVLVFPYPSKIIGNLFFDIKNQSRDLFPELQLDCVTSIEQQQIFKYRKPFILQAEGKQKFMARWESKDPEFIIMLLTQLKTGKIIIRWQGSITTPKERFVREYDIEEEIKIVI